jgi:hypothetical protein
MLMESAIRCDRVTPLKRDRYLEPELEPEPEQKRLKSEQEPKLTSDSNESDSDESDSDESDDDSLEKQVKSEQEPKLTSDSDESDSDESDDDSLEKRVKSEQEPKLTSETNEYDSDEAREEADKVYREKKRGLSPYDAIPRPPKSQLCSRNFVRLLVITEHYVPVLQRLSKLALDHYEKVSGASFEFHGIVKCNYDFNDFNYRPGVCQIINYYITFGAKAKGHPAVKLFRAKVSEDQLNKDKEPSVEECYIYHG